MVGLNCIPVLPYISDSDEHLEQMILEGRNHGAEYILVGGLTLFGEGPADSKTLYYRFLELNFPELMSNYQALYGNSSMPPRNYTNSLATRVRALCRKHQIRNSILHE